LTSSPATTQRPYYYACGKRKTSIARVKLFLDGTGEVQVNGRPLKQHFPGILPDLALAPLSITNHLQTFDLEVTVQGGGITSQAEAMRHGVSRALLLSNPELRTVLKRAGFLRRDARIKERKKPGLKRARRAPQWQKR
jgi:small subunit ribosomal protein S9